MSPLHADYLAQRKTSAPSTKHVAQRRGGAAVEAEVSVWMCLVLSVDADRRRRLLDLTEEAGWNPVECESVGEAIRQADRWRTRLAVLDFCGLPAKHRDTFRRFAERLALRPEPLLLVCDDSAGEGELWARQTGAWVYLPDPQLGDDLVRLCSEAIVAAEKQAEAQQPARATAQRAKA
jgi:DNA-binding NtrC family response regulator